MDFEEISQLSNNTRNTQTTRPPLFLTARFLSSDTYEIALSDDMRHEDSSSLEKFKYIDHESYKAKIKDFAESASNCNLKLRVEFENRGLPFVSNMLKFLKQENLKIDDLKITSLEESSDKIVQKALDLTSEASNLYLNCKTSSSFHPVLDTPFRASHLTILEGSWVTCDHLSNIFIICKNITIGRYDLDTEGLIRFFKKWMAGSEMRKAELLHSGEKLEDVMEALGAKPVENVNIQEEPHKFNQGECYMIQQENGTQAVVYKMGKSHIVLKTEFELI